MKKILLVLLLIFTGPFVFSQTPGDYVPNEIMVMLDPGNTVDDLLKDLNGQGLVGQFRLKQVLSNRYRIFLLEHDAILGDSKKLVGDIHRMDHVALAQLNHYIEDRATPNDPSYASTQWSMNNTGQTGGTVDADIDAPAAWDITTGGVTADGDTIVVAVVDGGVQESHPDLNANMWRNYVELNGTALVDDDGNGYIDDFEGWDATGDDNVVPTSGHATHCAGIVGARGNNSTGVAGVNWNVKILNVRGSSGMESVVVLAYDYISSLRELYNTSNGTMGAFVVATSNSFGVNYGQPINYPIWCAMYDTLGALGILSAGAGPNLNINIDTDGDIPTTCPSNYMVGVTNTTDTDIKNSGAGYGPIHIDIGAPGTSINSTYSGSGYNTLTGTSMATPHVAGAIGLYYSGACLQFAQDYKIFPGEMSLFIRNYLLTGVDSIASMANITSSEGRLNLHKGLLKVQTYDCSGLPPVADFIGNTNVCVGIPTQFTDNSSGNIFAYDWSFPGGSPSSSVAQNPQVTYNTPGVYNVQLIVTSPTGSDTILYTNYVLVYANPSAPTIVDNAGTLESSYTGVGNQWYVNGSPIGGATNDTYTPVSGGSYTVVYTDSNGCSATSAPFISTIGISNEPSIHFTIYPNPATEKVTIDAGTIIKATVKLMDLSGRVVMVSKMNQSLLQLDLSQFSDGVYLLKIEYGDKLMTKKLIKH